MGDSGVSSQGHSRGDTGGFSAQRGPSGPSTARQRWSFFPGSRLGARSPRQNFRFRKWSRGDVPSRGPRLPGKNRRWHGRKRNNGEWGPCAAVLRLKNAGGLSVRCPGGLRAVQGFAQAPWANWEHIIAEHVEVGPRSPGYALRGKGPSNTAMRAPVSRASNCGTF
jgi:hypothetical protein